MKRAAIYCRISSDPNHDELGVRRQEADCRALCERDGIEVVAVLVDDDQSAYSRKRRPGYEQLVALIADRQVSVVVAWHPDRLTRHPRELEDLIDALEAARCTVRTVQSGEYDLSTSSGRLTARVVGAVARGESEHKSDRLRRKHDELASLGKVPGGGAVRPFGFEVDRITHRKSEVKIIRELARRALAGEGTHALAVDLERRGVTGVTGVTMRSQTLRGMLTNPRLAGLRDHRTGQTKAVWKEIISVDDHRRLVALLADPSRRHAAPARTSLLTGFTHCGACGAKLLSSSASNGKRSLVCRKSPGRDACGGLRCQSGPLEEHVTAVLFDTLDSPSLSAAGPAAVADDTADLDELRRIEERATEAAEMLAVGELDRAGYAVVRKRLDADRQKINAQVRLGQTSTAATPYAGRPGALAAKWPKMTLDERRAVCMASIERITVAPANGVRRFDPARVTITWRL